MVTVCNFVWSRMLEGPCQKYAVVAALMNSGLEASKCQKRRRLSTACNFLNKQVHKVSTIRTNTYLSGWSMLKSNAFRIHLLNMISVTLAGHYCDYWPWYGSALINNLCLLTNSYRELVQMCRLCRLCLAVSSLHTYSQHDPKQLRLEIHLPQTPSRVKLGTLWRSVHCQRLLSTVVQLFSCHGPAKVSTADGHSSHVKADKAGPICASKPRKEENPNIVLSVPDTLKDFTWWLTRSFSTFLHPCSQQRRSVWPMCSATSALQTSLLRWPHIFLLHSSQVASNIQTRQSDSSSMKNLSFRFWEVVACGLLCGPPLQPHILMTWLLMLSPRSHQKRKLQRSVC